MRPRPSLRLVLSLLAAGVTLSAAAHVRGACCYFAAKDKDVNQPSQKAFIAWDEGEKVESFTVQPKFEGNAQDFGMVVPTPGKPRLDEMPRDFFKELAVFTILEPMDLTKYKLRPMPLAATGAVRGDSTKHASVKVLEAGVVGSLDYKIIQAGKADDLFDWLKENKYNYAGDQPTLDHYIKKGWFFTVMKIDAKQMKPKADGSFDGEVTPTRFQFTSEKLVYPLRLTHISVRDKTEALFYVQAAHKVDLPGGMSYEATFTPMWYQAAGYAIPGKLTEQEKAWQSHVKNELPRWDPRRNASLDGGPTPASLEWAKKLTESDVQVLSGEKKYNRDAPPEDVEKLKVLKGHLKQGQFVTKIRKAFKKDEMGEDLEFVRAKVAGRDDDIEYYSILPTSPP